MNIYGNALLFTVQGTVTTENEITFVSGKIAYAYEFNLHGDVVKVLGIAGIVLNTYTYDAFGVITSQTATVENTFFYAGYQYDDETGLYYLRSRYYNAETARFITEDSFSGYYNDPLSLNRYTYCHNSPVIYFDPDGEFWNLVAGLVGTVVGAVVGGGVDLVGQLVTGTNLSDVDWKSVGASAAEGAIIGGVSGMTAGNPAAVALASAAGNAVKQGINKGFENVDYGEVVISGAVGFVSAGAGKVVAKNISSIASSTLNKFTKVSLGALAEGVIEGGVDLGSQALEILAGERESIDFIQTTTAFGMGVITGAFQTNAEIKKSTKHSTTTDWYDEGGNKKYPPNDGAVSGTEKSITLEKDSTVVRYGNSNSKYCAAPNQSIDSLSIPPWTDVDDVNYYFLSDSIENVQISIAAPWGNRPGGGIQYALPDTITNLEKLGVLIKEIK